MITSINGSVRSAGDKVTAPEDELRDKCELRIAQLMFELLSAETGYTPPWGVLTGVRPSKLMLRLTAQLGEQGAMDYFTKGLLVSPEKARLAATVAKAEEQIVASSSRIPSASMSRSRFAPQGAAIAPLCRTR